MKPLSSILICLTCLFFTVVLPSTAHAAPDPGPGATVAPGPDPRASITPRPTPTSSPTATGTPTITPTTTATPTPTATATPAPTSCDVASTGPGCSDSDDDNDETPGSQDACPGTADNARLVGRGCSALGLVRDSGNLINPVVTKAGKARANLIKLQVPKRVTSQIKRGIRRLTIAKNRLLPKGKLCDGFKFVNTAQRQIKLANRKLKLNTARLIKQYEEEYNGIHNADFGDVSWGQVKGVFLKIVKRQLGTAISEVRNIRGLFKSSCRMVARKRLKGRGFVEEYNDSSRTLKLTNGKIFQLAPRKQGYNIFKGAQIRIQDGTKITDGTGIINQVNVKKGTAIADPSDAPSIQPCLLPRIAPVQRMAPYNPGPYTLHYLSAYYDTVGATTAYWLEQEMSIAAISSGNCPGDEIIAPNIPFYRYSLRVSIRQGSKGDTFAEELRPSDPPVMIPSGYANGATSVLSVALQRKKCVLKPATGLRVKTEKASTPPGSGIFCELPVDQETNSYTVFMRKQGAYCTANYEETFLSVDEHNDNDFDSTYVASLDFESELFSALANVNPTFTAEAYAVNGGNSSRPAVVNIVGNQPFAIYNDDFGDDYMLPVFHTGTDFRAGVRWPRVVGTRGGRQLWYSCKVPHLVRDVLNYCGNDPAPHSFYRLPFKDGWPIWSSSGNWRSDGLGHCGKDPDGNVVPFNKCLQRYAWDFGCNPAGETIVATRGGVVEAEFNASSVANDGPCWSSKNTCHYNCNKDFDDGNTTAAEEETCHDNCHSTYSCDVGNFVFIAHQDGSYGVYWHLQGPDKMSVKPGDRVKRGDSLGPCGNTGASGGPHLHYHVQPLPGTDSSFSIATSFQALDPSCNNLGVCTPTSTVLQCYLAPRNAVMFSNNN